MPLDIFLSFNKLIENIFQNNLKPNFRSKNGHIYVKSN